jgi:hypothetical protein
MTNSGIGGPLSGRRSVAIRRQAVLPQGPYRDASDGTQARVGTSTTPTAIADRPPGAGGAGLGIGGPCLVSFAVTDDEANQRDMRGSWAGSPRPRSGMLPAGSCHARSPTIAPLTAAGAVGIRIGDGR